MDDSDDEFVPDDDVPMRQAKPRPAPKKKPAAAPKKEEEGPPEADARPHHEDRRQRPAARPAPKAEGEGARRQSRTAASPRDPQGDLPPLRHHRKHEQALLQRMYTFRGPPPFDRFLRRDVRQPRDAHAARRHGS